MSTATTTDSADFYALERLLDDDERTFLHRVRDFMKSEVEPTSTSTGNVAAFRSRSSRDSGNSGWPGCRITASVVPEGRILLDGMVAMELARTDPSIATFTGCTAVLSMGSIYLCGSDEQKQRYLPEMARSRRSARSV